MTELTMDAERAEVAAAGQYLTFELAGESYGLPILRVRELLGLLPITPIPRTAEQVRGVINLRGQVVAVLDLRRRLGLPPAEAGAPSCIIVVEALGTAGAKPVGLVVDRVSEVRDLPASRIEPPPTLSSSAESGCLIGLGKLDSLVLLLLDVDEVLADLAGLALAEGRQGG